MNMYLRLIEQKCSRMSLGDSLLFLNQLICGIRGIPANPNLAMRLEEVRPPIIPHLPHFIAKQLLLHSSVLATDVMNLESFTELATYCLRLDDPIVHDPEFKDKDPTGFFERILAQQGATQISNYTQNIGLALGLFRDVGKVNCPKSFDIRQELRKSLDMDIEQFILLGQIMASLSIAKIDGFQCVGTFDHMHLVEAFRQGVSLCVPELWGPFLERTSCDQVRFRALAKSQEYVVDEDMFEAFGFNPLRRFPIVDVGGQKYVSMDPIMVNERVTRGLFYDLFEQDRIEFARKFGAVFDRFVGNLIGTVCSPERLWHADDYSEQSSSQWIKGAKKGDLAYKGNSYTVLFENKSIRPTIELISKGTVSGVDEVCKRLSQAIIQLSTQAGLIKDGQGKPFGLLPSECIGVVVTYGRFFCANGPMARKNLRQMVVDKGVAPIPFVVLSMEELDSVIALAERGHALDGVIMKMASNDNLFMPLDQFKKELEPNGMSSVTSNRAASLLSQLISYRGDPSVSV
jgi:hypothetical protein